MGDGSAGNPPAAVAGSSRSSPRRPPASRAKTLPATVLLDLDDTLFDHSLSCRAALARVRAREKVLRSRDLDSIWSEYLASLELLWGDVLAGRLGHEESRTERFRRIVAFCGGSATRKDAERLAAAYRRYYAAERRLIPGARALLERLHGRAVVTVVTNSMVAEQEEKLDHFGLRPLVDHLVVSEGVGASKPQPEIFSIALDLSRAGPEEAVMFGDSWTNDVLGARAAGIRAVWFNRFERANPEPDVVPEVRSLRPTPRVERALSRAPPRVRSARK